MLVVLFDWERQEREVSGQWRRKKSTEEIAESVGTR